MARKSKPGNHGSGDLPEAPDKASSSAAPKEEEYKVGPGRPPKKYQWKKGQSGNPKGAKRKEPPIAPELRALFLRSFNRKAKMKDGDREELITMFDAGMQQLAVQFAKGDRYARRDTLWIMEKLGIDLSKPSAALDKTLPTDQQAILDAYFERRMQDVNSSASSPMIAPPELLDDDTPDEPNES